MSTEKSKIRNWILDKNPRLPALELDDDTPLLEAKILTSIQIMDLILFLEYLQGHPVDIDQVQPDNFYSINTIYEAFFAKVT